MFKEDYQGGAAVEVFSAQGKDPVAKWKLHGGPSAIRKEYKKDIKGFVYCLEGDIHNVKMQIPENRKMSLGLSQQFIVLQVKIPEGKHFCVELLINSSDNQKKRLYFSTLYKILCITEFHARIPFLGVKQNMWTSLCINLEAFTSELFKCTYAILDGITLSAACEVRRIFTMKTEPTGTLEDGMFLTGADMKELIPRSCQFPKDIENVTQLLNRNYIVNLQIAQMRTGVFKSDCGKSDQSQTLTLCKVTEIQMCYNKDCDLHLVSLMQECMLQNLLPEAAVLTTLCKDFQSEALQLAHQTEMQLVSRILMVPLEKVERMGGGRDALLICHRKCRRYCALFARELELGAADNLHRCVIDEAWCLAGSGSPEVNNELFCFVDVQEQYLGRQSQVNKVNSRGLRMQPWGEPVFKDMTLEVLFHTWTDWVLPVRKSSSQLHKGVLRPSWLNFHTRSWGLIVFNAELKSRNSIRTWVFFSSRCSRLRWRAVEMASSVEQLGWYANWCGSNDEDVPSASAHAKSASCSKNRIQNVSHTASGFKVSGYLAQTGQKTSAPSDGKDRIGHCIQNVGPLSLQMNPDITSETQNISMQSETSSPSERYHGLQKAVPEYALSGAREKNCWTRGTSGPPSTEQDRIHQPVTEKSKHQTTDFCSDLQVRSSRENNESQPQLTLQEMLFTFPFHLRSPRQEQTISDQKKMAMTDGQVQSEIDSCCEAQLDGILIGSESDEVNSDKRPEGVDCSVSDMPLLDSLKIHVDDDEELRMLASLKREQEEDECGASGFSTSQIYQSNVSVSISSDYTSTWTHIPMPANQGHHYQKKMNPLLCSNPREWMEVLSPPIMPPNQGMSSGTTGNWVEDLIKGREEPVNEEENEGDDYLNLFYDPCLKQYFDPKTGKYYELV
ncbi:uncharacterized protein C3orf67 homolog [Thalassophryne amazonica]|uniref:uncharacterized protein C3orf67 homolog n=1 Tax=Thalassophryne amazonica TaxID=390379 RepID=UPI001471645C|nr:uncharacterized protein C3orf67 homolog [Thalassophryne amazonica]